MKLSKLVLLSALVLFVPVLSANIISVNLAFGPTGGAAVDGEEVFGVPAEGTVLGNWNNVAQPLGGTPSANLIREDATESGVQIAVYSAGGYAYWGAPYKETALNYGAAHYVATANEVSMSILNLNAEYPDGYYIILYVNGATACEGAAVTDGTTTYYFKPKAVQEATPVQITDTNPDDGYDVGNYIVFGSAEAPLMADATTFTIPTGSVLTNNAGIAGAQIVPASSGAPTWAGYPVDEAGNVDTTPWMGFINVAAGEWVWSYSLGKWIYLPEEFVSESGAWAYATNF
jgi:hypothetical protein